MSMSNGRLSFRRNVMQIFFCHFLVLIKKISNTEERLFRAKEKCFTFCFYILSFEFQASFAAKYTQFFSNAKFSLMGSSTNNQKVQGLTCFEVFDLVVINNCRQTLLLRKWTILDLICIWMQLNLKIKYERIVKHSCASMKQIFKHDNHKQPTRVLPENQSFLNV